MAESKPAKEYTVFITHFAKLVDTLNPQHVLQYLITGNVISVDDSEHILAAVTMKDKTRKLLELLAGPLKAGHIRGLWGLLDAMELHGNEAEKELARIIKSDFTNCSENPPVLAPVPKGDCDTPDLPHHKKEGFMKLLVGLSDYLDEVDSSFVKRFKLSLKFYSVTDRGVKVAKEVYESVNNIPDILENLAHYRYITIDNVDLLETAIKSSIANDQRYIQLGQHTLSIVEEYKKSLVLYDTESSVPTISIASLPIDSQYIVVSTSYPAVALRHKEVEEIGNAIFSALSLPKLYSHFCGFEGELVTLCWNLHGKDRLKDYHLEVPDYDHCQWLKHLGVLAIKVMNDLDCQVVDLQLINYTGCLVLPDNCSANEWMAEFLCVPVGYENIIKMRLNPVMQDQACQGLHQEHKTVFFPIGFESFVSGDDHELSLRLLAPDLSQYGWSVNTYRTIDKYVVDGVVGMDMPELLPYILIEVQATGIHHSDSFPGCKVEIEGSYYNQSFMLASTSPVEGTEDLQVESVYSSDIKTDYMYSVDALYTEYYQVEDWAMTMQQQTTMVGWQIVSQDHYSPR